MAKGNIIRVTFVRNSVRLRSDRSFCRASISIKRRRFWASVMSIWATKVWVFHVGRTLDARPLQTGAKIDQSGPTGWLLWGRFYDRQRVSPRERCRPRKFFRSRSRATFRLPEKAGESGVCCASTPHSSASSQWNRILKLGPFWGCIQALFSLGFPYMQTMTCCRCCTPHHADR